MTSRDEDLPEEAPGGAGSGEATPEVYRGLSASSPVLPGSAAPQSAQWDEPTEVLEGEARSRSVPLDPDRYGGGSQPAGYGADSLPPVRPDFDSIYIENWGRLVGALCRFPCRGDQARAEQIAQETFLQAFRCGQKFLDCPNHFGWLKTAATRIAIDDLRRDMRRRSKERQRQVLWPDKASDEFSSVLVQDLVDRLPLREQMVFTCLLRDFTRLEIAKTIGVSVRTVDSDIRRGLRRMRRSLGLPEEGQGRG